MREESWRSEAEQKGEGGGGGGVEKKREGSREGRKEGAWIETNESLVAVFALLFQEEVRQTTTRQGQTKLRKK